MTEPVILVVGDGELADSVCRLLTGEVAVWRFGTLLAEADFNAKWNHDGATVPQLALLLHDGWLPAMEQEAHRLFQSIGIPWLRGLVSFGQGIAGPLVHPGVPGCAECADRRRLLAGADVHETFELREECIIHGGVARDVYASQTGLRQVAHLIAAEVQRFVQGKSLQMTNHLYLVNLKTLQVSRHHVLADPLCPVCGQLPDDSPELAIIKLEPSLKSGPMSYRSRPLAELQASVPTDYLDYRTGLLNAKVHDLVSPFATASVNLPLWQGNEGCAGRSAAYNISELTAMLEGLERYCGIMPRSKRTVVHGSYAQLADDALDPATLGLHAAKNYTATDFPYEAYRADRPMDWVWGYSLGQARPLLVPLQYAYYSLGGEGGFVYETSNGCALGGSLTEAIFYGLMEVVERDAFLMTWYAQLHLPHLRLIRTDDAELVQMVDVLERTAGYRIHLFNATMEHGIPSIFAIAENQRDTGPCLVCAAGAHLDAARAAKGAVHEVAGMFHALGHELSERRAEAEQMFAQSRLVRHMEHHSLLYSLPQAAERLDFLLHGSGAEIAFADAFVNRPWQADITDDVRDLVGVFMQLQMDVIVVNQTAPELVRNQLHCVKVIIPGMLPMTFGHHLTRLEGLNRVLTVPVQLGFRNQPLTQSDLNPFPHPFP